MSVSAHWCSEKTHLALIKTPLLLIFDILIFALLSKLPYKTGTPAYYD